ncbi:photosynthetic complex assembly protein PuhC [Lichenicoccus sp.]|uniref:photosynthetic complex assembly protein PuhC n=1 Tax=Lichenicoccus sp. TaxID=2781899 RepID=UPI003D0FAFAE
MSGVSSARRQTGSRRRIPIPPLIALGLASMIGIVGLMPVKPSPPPGIVMQRKVQFLDTADGGIVVRDAATRRTIIVIPANDEGFGRALIHTLEVMRRRYGQPLDPPYQLQRLADGRLVLNDPLSPMHLDLESFGTSNEAIFSLYLGERPAP